MVEFEARAQAIASLDALVAALAPYAGAVVRLLAADFAPNDNLPWASLTEAAFTGYGASTAIVWGAAFYSNDIAGPLVVGDLKSFACSGGVGEVLYGYAVAAAGPVVLRLGKFNAPQAIAAGGQIKILPQIPRLTEQGIAEVNPIIA
jgi:hypothetical protein